jgi:poly-beta-1,6-N-acetyl-D-glucosamine synthase
MSTEMLSKAPGPNPPPGQNGVPPSRVENSLEAELLGLLNSTEAMQHRAADCGLTDLLELTQATSAQLARLRLGDPPLAAVRLAPLHEIVDLLSSQLDAHFEGRPLDPAVLDDVRAKLAVIAQGARRGAPPPALQIQDTKKPGIYLSIRTKFQIAIVGALLWTGLSIYLAGPWYDQLSGAVGPVFATLIIAGIAIIPGFMNAFLLMGLCMDHRPRHTPLDHYPAITILVAAYNEAASIVETLKSIDLQHYTGKLDVIVINDGSSDGTGALVAGQMSKYPWLRLIDLPQNGGKAKALNHGLAAARASLVLTVDADSYLFHDALQNIVERYFEDPHNTRAVAGTVVVRNSRLNWVTKVQEWDYFHGISAIKRVQSLFQGTLVAQGAFSLYDRATLVKVGGWPDCVGEDIVLTWAILKAGYRVGHSEEAYLFTNAPDTVRQFVRQRQRWARGMIEGFKKHPDIMIKPHMSTLFVYWNLLFPVLDLVFTVAFIPGIILALFGHFEIVGPMTLALLPIAMAMNFMMYSIGRKSFDDKHLKVRRNIPGFFLYTLAYNLIMQPACLMGYVSEMLNLKKTWGTK